ncbi:MotE family protein [Aestuariibius insulae]|uniref:MotE family protein n=1 Tax=Aestuariibius insulae TaxID=2058287 RepID=UPI00345EBD6A
MSKTGKGTLGILAVLLVGSGVLRVGEGTGWVFAQTADEGQIEGDVAVCDPDGMLEEVLAALQTREDEVRVREIAVQNRIVALDLANDQIDRKLAELEAAEASLAETLAVARTAAQDDLTSLSGVYEAMKPKDAALLFAEMPPEFAAGFLGRMRPETAAEIMAGLPASNAYSISVVMAGRNALVPTE